MIQITEITPTIAQLAVTLAGFSAVIVALRPKPISEWKPFDRFNFRILIQVAAVTTFFSIFPFAALAIFEPQQAWKLSLLAYGVFHLIDLISFSLKFPIELGRANRIAVGIGFVVAVLQIGIGFLGSPAAVQVMYLSALVWQLGVACFGFVLLIYLSVDDKKS
jgi:hypothetical protein